MPKSLRGYHITIILVALCICAAQYTNLGRSMTKVSRLAITEFEFENWGAHSYYPGLPEIRKGEVWRLITPSFNHFSIWQILFNVLWIFSFCKTIEKQLGAWHLVLLCVTISALSNLSQYLADGPLFGGMFGLILGLGAYIWVRSKLDPDCGLQVSLSTIVILGIWLVVSFFFPASPYVAYAAGAFVGAAWAILFSKRFVKFSG